MSFDPRLPVSSLFFFSFILLSGAAFAHVPPLFEGELNVCETLERSAALGTPPMESLTDFIRSQQSNNPEVLQSIRRTIIHKAIIDCRMDAAVVLTAAYSAGVSPELIVGSAAKAGVDEGRITDLMVGLGVESRIVAFAIEQSKEPGEEAPSLPPSGAVVQVPPLFKSKSYVCDAIHERRASGQTLTQALTSFIRGHQSNDPELLQSMQRTIIHNAIAVCRLDATIVMAAAYSAGIPPELIVFAALAAGVDKSEIEIILVRLGVDLKTVADAMDEARRPKRVELKLPPGNELGPSTPFLP
jgi:hypothetical protein